MASPSSALTSSADTPSLTVASDTITGTSANYGATDIIVDGSTADSDTMTITATSDITATPTVVNIENVNFNIGETLAGGNAEFAVAVTTLLVQPSHLM